MYVVQFEFTHKTLQVGKILKKWVAPFSESVSVAMTDFLKSFTNVSNSGLLHWARKGIRYSRIILSISFLLSVPNLDKDTISWGHRPKPSKGSCSLSGLYFLRASLVFISWVFHPGRPNRSKSFWLDTKKSVTENNQITRIKTDFKPKFKYLTCYFVNWTPVFSNGHWARNRRLG